MTSPRYHHHHHHHHHPIAWSILLALITNCFVISIISGPQLTHCLPRATVGWQQSSHNPNRFLFVRNPTGPIDPYEPGPNLPFESPSRLPPPQPPPPPPPPSVLVPPEPNPRDLYLHAYDSSKCGQFANFRDWQKRENAFNCWAPSFMELIHGKARQKSKYLSNAAHPRIVDGIRADEGEFPFYVRLTIYKQINATHRGVAYCGGTLIHDNIVLTVAHCLTGGVNRITVTLGTNLANGEGGIQVDADKWCNHFEFDPVDVTKRDLAMIRLRQSVKYENNRIVPACLYSHIRHRDGALCSVTGMGFVNDRFEPATNLMTLPVRRRCIAYDVRPYSSCYVAEQVGTTCPGDSGAPVLCYDQCGKSRQTTRAFVVGAVSWGSILNKCRPGQPLWHFMMSDFNWMHKSIEYLVVAMRNDYNLPYGYAQCTLTFRPPAPPGLEMFHPNWND